MSCDVGEATEGLENELWRRWSYGNVGEWTLLIPQPLFRFSYVTGSSITSPGEPPMSSNVKRNHIVKSECTIFLRPEYRVNVGNFVIVLMMYYDITQREDQFVEGHIPVWNRSFSRSPISQYIIKTITNLLTSRNYQSLPYTFSKQNQFDISKFSFQVKVTCWQVSQL